MMLEGYALATRMMGPIRSPLRVRESEEEVRRKIMQNAPRDFPAEVRERFSRLALTPNQESVFPVGPESAKALGYDPDEIDALPRSVTESFAGVGNRLSLAEFHPGEIVMDLGCGAGLDSILAARHVGPSSRVIDVDMTPEMVAKARRNIEGLGVTNVEFREGRLENLPVEDAGVDVAISNGVFNLCPDKPRVLSETHRVLRLGGRLQMADIVLHEDVTEDEVAEKGEWSD
jgi:SAM-dependent methyltransferase